MVIIIMGVSGCGKSTVGKLMADLWESDFVDADEHHPKENIKKMASGNPLGDADRVPWLLGLRKIIADSLDKDNKLVMACSALKKSYREVLGRDDKRIKFVYLAGSPEQILPRMEDREGHFMPAELLQSQFDELEVPSEDEALHFSIEMAPMEIAHEALEQLTSEENMF